MHKPDPPRREGRPLFAGRFAQIVTMVGISVGLGNVWRFPYMMGSYGGSAFLIIYLMLTAAFAIPAVMAEWGLGRATRHGPIGAFKAALGRRAGMLVGLMLMVTILMAEAYYIYVVGNVAYAAGFSAFVGFAPQQIDRFHFHLGLASIQYGVCLLLLAVSYVVLRRGLNRGIASLSKIFVPFFLITMLVLIAFALRLENAAERLLQYLRPDFARLGPDSVFAALGQSFFSLGLGGTFLVVFGSYIKSDDNLLESATLTALGDVLAAVMAGLFIVPTVLALGLDMGQGPTLLFKTLPELFQRLPFGRLLGSLFLLALLTVTFISSIAALEVLLSGLTDLMGARVSRARLIAATCVLEALILVPIALDPSIIGSLDLIFGSGMQVLGSGLALLGLTWGIGKSGAIQAVWGSTQSRWHEPYYLWVKWVVPAALLSVLVGYVLTQLR